MNHYPTKVNVRYLHNRLFRGSVVKKIAKLMVGMISSILLINVCVASNNPNADIQAQYVRDRAACIDGATQESKTTCLKEAGAARQAAMAGKLASGDANQFQRNRERRCDAHTGDDREYCLQRMRGEGNQSGSVDQGGVLRELTVPVAPQPTQ